MNRAAAGLVAWLLVLAAQGAFAQKAGCQEVQRAVREAPPSYVVTARIWLSGREVYYEKTRVLNGHAQTLAKRTTPNASFRLDASRSLAVPSCSTLSRARNGVWEAREHVQEISGERVLVYHLRNGQLVRMETRESGTIGALFFKKTLRTSIIYELEVR